MTRGAPWLFIDNRDTGWKETAGPLRYAPVGGCDFFDFPRFCHAQPDCCLKLPQGRHPERSASQIYRLTEGFWRAIEEPVPSVAEGTPTMLVSRCSPELSSHQNYERNQKSHKL